MENMKRVIAGLTVLMGVSTAVAGVVSPKATDEALINPGMGLVHYAYSSRIWAYDTGLEPKEGDFRWDLFDSLLCSPKGWYHAHWGRNAATGDIIVVPDRPTAVERSAAAELADGIRRMTGVEPRIVSEDSAGMDRKRFYVGRTPCCGAG